MNLSVVNAFHAMTVGLASSEAMFVLQVSEFRLFLEP